MSYGVNKFLFISKSNHVSVQFSSVAQMFKLVLEKAEEPEIKLPTSPGSSKKQESSRKTSISALLTMPKPLPGSGSSPGVGNGNSVQYACLENSMNRGTWGATLHRVTKS